MRETASIASLFCTIIERRSSTKKPSFGGFSSCPENFWKVLCWIISTLFLCSFWYKSTWIFEKWSQFRIIHFLKQLFGAIWLFETPFRGWNDIYMDYSTDTPTHPSTQYRYALGICSRTTSRITRTNSRITRTASYMIVKSMSSSLWCNSVTPENQSQSVPATPKNPVWYCIVLRAQERFVYGMWRSA